MNRPSSKQPDRDNLAPIRRLLPFSVDSSDSSARRRRAAWGAVSGVLSSAALLIVASCGGGGAAGGGGGGGGGGGTPPTGNVVGRAAIPGVGSPTSLTIVTARQSSAAVDALGDYRTTVAVDAAQVVAAIDASGRVRGLALSVPDGSGHPPGSLAIDAESTALALLFLSPGVLTTNPTEAAARATFLRGRPTFGNLASHLASELASRSLPEVAASAAYDNLLRACLADWLQTRQPDGGRGIVADSALHGTSLSLPSDLAQNDGRNATVVVSNGGWRFLGVYRRTVSADGSLSAISPVYQGTGCLSGAAASHLHAVLGASGTAGSGSDGPQDLGAAAETHYYFAGPGMLPDAAPQDVALLAASDQVPFVSTLIAYCYLPLCAVAAGVDGSLSPPVLATIPPSVTQGLVATLSANGSLETARTHGDPKAREAAYASLVGTLSSLTSFSRGLFQGAGDADAAMSGLTNLAGGTTTMLSRLESVLAPANFSLFQNSLTPLPRSHRLRIVSQGDGQVVVK